jgi:gluconolactonase
MDPSLTVYREEVFRFINKNYEIEKLDSTCSFSEGPVWNEAGYYLFSDIPENRICKLIPGISKETYVRGSGCTIAADYLSAQTGSNGLAYGKNGKLFICQHGNGAIATYHEGEEIETLVGENKGKPLNSPNDIVVHDDGSVFFSDPPYGLKDQQLNPEQRQSFAAFYCFRNGELLPFCREYRYPNGVCFSPGQQSVYCCSTKPFEKYVLEYDVKTLQLKRHVAEENSDGIKCDREGNIYLCTGEGIVIIDTAGNRLAKIELSTVPANCCWGGEEENDLFITARQNIFLIKGLQRVGVVND